MSRAIELFESDTGALSMSRLLLLGAFIIAGIIMIMLTLQEKMSEGYMTIFLSGFVGTYLGGKGIDRKPIPTVTMNDAQVDVTVKDSTDVAKSRKRPF